MKDGASAKLNKGYFKNRIKSILVIQTLMFMLGITLLTKGYFDDSSFIRYYSLF